MRSKVLILGHPVAKMFIHLVGLDVKNLDKFHRRDAV